MRLEARGGTRRLEGGKEEEVRGSRFDGCD